MRAQRTAAVLLATATIALVLGTLRDRRSGPIEKEEGNGKPSGSYEALSFWGASRAYPGTALPDTGFYAAWQAMRAERGKAASIDGVTAPWASMGPANIGGRTLSIALRPDDPSVMFAGSASGGLWKTTTGGVGADAWDYVETGEPVLGVAAIELSPKDPDVMYIGTGEGYDHQVSNGGDAVRRLRGSYGIGILKSEDGGASWVKSLDWSYAQNRGVWVVRFHPSGPDTVFAATTEGIYRTTDAGLNWSQVLGVVVATDLHIFPDNPDRIIAGCGNFGSPGQGIYRSTDGGDTWSKMSTGLPASWTGKTQLAIAPSAPNLVFASIADSSAGRGLWASTDTGVSWSQRTTLDFQQYQGFYSHWVMVDPTNAQHVFVGGIEIWESGNGGVNFTQLTNWQQVFMGQPPPEGPAGGPQYAHADQHFATFHPTDPNTMFIGSDGGVFRTTDGGSTFRSLNGGYVTGQFYNGFSSAETNPLVAVGGLQDNFTAIWDGTNAWIRVIGGDGGWSAIHPTDALRMWAEYQYLNIARSTNGGANWTFLSVPGGAEPTAFIAPFVLSPSVPQTLYGGRAKVYKSTNSGSNWVATNAGVALDGSNPLLQMAISRTSRDTVYAASTPVFSSMDVFRTTNGGTSWSAITGSLPDRYAMDLFVEPGDSRRAYVALGGFGTSHLFRTTDAGGSWVDVGAGLPDVPTTAVTIDPDHTEVIYVGNDLGVWVSPNAGASWEPFASGMPTAMVNDLSVHAGTRKLRVATHGNGAFQRDLWNPSATGVEIVEAEGAGLAPGIDVRPNPVSSVSRVSFRLASPGHVRLTVHDAAGRRLASLLDEIRPAGDNEASLRSADLPAGVLFLRLEVGGKMSSRRVVNIR